MHEFKTHSVLYRVIRVYYALNCNLNNTMQITFRWDFSGRILYFSLTPTETGAGNQKGRKSIFFKHPIRRVWPSSLDSAVSLVALCTHHMCQANRYKTAATVLQLHSRWKIYTPWCWPQMAFKSLKQIISLKSSSPPIVLLTAVYL